VPSGFGRFGIVRFAGRAHPVSTRRQRAGRPPRRTLGHHARRTWYRTCERRVGGGTAIVPNVTLLDLLTEVAKDARSEKEVIATVAYMVNSGRVRLCGNFKGARFDLDALADDVAA